MAEVKKINVGPALTVPLALARKGGQIATDNLEKYSVSEKFSKVKDHPTVAKITNKSDMLLTILGMILLFHGVQFKNLFLCTQVMMAFCYGRVKGSITTLYSDVTTSWEKAKSEGESEETKADAKAEAKPASKHAEKRAAKKDDSKPTQEQREEDAAAAKKVLKVVDSDKVTGVVFELCVSAMACHMVMEGGLAKVVVVSHALVKFSKAKIHSLLEFAGHEDLQAWTDLLVTFVLYLVFGSMAVIAAPLAFAVNVAACGAQLVTEHGLRIAEGMGKIPAGLSAEAFAASTKGLAVLGGLTAFGTLWQFWALMADNGMAWYFKMLYLPGYIGEGVISLF
jgi:hypothetical protein